MKRLTFWYNLMHSKFWNDSQDFEHLEFCPTVGYKWNISANSVLQYTHFSNVLPSYQVKILLGQLSRYSEYANDWTTQELGFDFQHN